MINSTGLNYHFLKDLVLKKSYILSDNLFCSTSLTRLNHHFVRIQLEKSHILSDNIKLKVKNTIKNIKSIKTLDKLVPNQIDDQFMVQLVQLVDLIDVKIHCKIEGCVKFLPLTLCTQIAAI